MPPEGQTLLSLYVGWSTLGLRNQPPCYLLGYWCCHFPIYVVLVPCGRQGKWSHQQPPMKEITCKFCDRNSLETTSDCFFPTLVQTIIKQWDHRSSYDIFKVLPEAIKFLAQTLMRLIPPGWQPMKNFLSAVWKASNSRVTPKWPSSNASSTITSPFLATLSRTDFSHYKEKHDNDVTGQGIKGVMRIAYVRALIGHT